jgi:hypothetical protein
MRQHALIISAAALALALGAAPPAFGAGTIATVAGPGVSGTSGDGGPATQAFMQSTVGVTGLADGSYLIAHQGAPAIRHVLPDGIITTVAGNGTAGYSGDGGPATSASLDGVSIAIAAPGGGYLIADPNNNVVRRVAPDGTISTVAGKQALGAGFGGDGGAATSAQLSFPFDVAFMPDGSYLIADKDNARVRRVGTDGTISTVAGGGGSLGDGGAATSAQLQEPSGVTPTPDGGYLIADAAHNRIRKVLGGTINTVAGNGTAGATGDGGPATSAELSRPVRTAMQADGGYLIAEQNGQRVRRVAPDGTISTVAGTGTAGFSGDGGPATAAQLNQPFGVGVLPSGDILVADGSNGRIRFVDVDTPPPSLSGTSPASRANENNPRVLGSAPAGTTIALFTSGDCSGASVAGGTAAELQSPGIVVPVADDSTTTVHALTIDAAGNRSACSSSSVTYQESSTVVPPPLPPPVRGVTVNAVPEKGKVLVKIGKKGFVPLASLGRSIPVGATIDTRKGTVRLTTAKGGKGNTGTQVGHFGQGVFRFTQTKKNPLVTLSMTGSGLRACSRLPRGGSPKVAAAKRKRRRTLFSNVKGRFRTRGRNSAATVRGTKWQMTDTCAGTRTTVQSGAVLVHDFWLRKNRLVKAGHSYFARVGGRKSHRA